MIGIARRRPTFGLLSFPFCAWLALALPAAHAESPGFSWSSYLGGNDYEYGLAIAVDGSGNVYAAGDTFSAGWVSGGFNTAQSGDWDGFVVKLSGAGAHLWSTYLGGSGEDNASSIAVDTFGNVYIAGYTASSGWVSGGFATNYGGGPDDAYVAKLSPDGAHLWSTYLGGGGDDVGNAVKTDGAGNVYLAGSTDSNMTNPGGLISGGYDASFGGVGDGFLVKLSGAGAHLWSTYLGGDGDESAFGLAVDSADYVYITGWTDAPGWIVGGFDVSFNGGDSDGFLVKLSGAGAHQWSTFLGGANSDNGDGVAVDPLGNVYVCGLTLSSGWVSGGFDTSHNGDFDGFEVKLAGGGAHLWSTFLGGSDYDDGFAIAVDAEGISYVSGQTASLGWVSGGIDGSLNGLDDAYVAKLSTDGAHLWSTYLGGTNVDYSNGLAVFGSTAIYVIGDTLSAGWIGGGFDNTFDGIADAFVVKLSAGINGVPPRAWNAYH
jgi:hypothetical protein